MSRKCRGGSSSQPGRAPQIGIDRRARRSSSGTSRRTDGSPAAAARIARSMMNLCGSNPHAAAGAGATPATASARTARDQPPLRHLSHSPLRISLRSVRRLRASHGSTSLLRRLSGVSSFGVSSSIGRRANRGSFSSRRNGSRPEAALADVLVPIDAAAARLLRVVQVKHLDAVEADDAIERLERLAIALFGADVVAGGQQVAGVEADADARRAVEPLEDRREVLEAVAEVGALPGGVLEQDHRCRAAAARRSSVRSPSAISRSPSSSVPVVNEPGCITSPSRPSASARSSSSTSAASDCSRSGSRRGSEVDQVAVVRDDRLDAGLGDAPPEQRRSRPAAARGRATAPPTW